MPSIGDKTGEGDEPQERLVMSEPPPPPPHETQHEQHLLQMTMHVYPFPHALGPIQQPPLIRAKRRQVKNACTNCQKACKKCDDARPCLRCVKYGIADDCVDSQRKERKRGVKRGPYKKRDGKDRAGSIVDQDDVTGPSRTKTADDTAPPRASAAESSTVPGHCPSIPYPQAYYAHYPPSGLSATSKPADGVQVCAPGPQPYFLDSLPHVPPHLHPIQEGDNGYATHSFYQPTLLSPMPYHHPQYPIIRPDNPSVHVPSSYPIYPITVYPKQTMGGQTEFVQGTRNSNDRPGLVRSKPG